MRKLSTFLRATTYACFLLSVYAVHTCEKTLPFHQGAGSTACTPLGCGQIPYNASYSISCITSNSDDYSLYLQPFSALGKGSRARTFDHVPQSFDTCGSMCNLTLKQHYAQWELCTVNQNFLESLQVGCTVTIHWPTGTYPSACDYYASACAAPCFSAFGGGPSQQPTCGNATCSGISVVGDTMAPSITCSDGSTPFECSACAGPPAPTPASNDTCGCKAQKATCAASSSCSGLLHNECHCDGDSLRSVCSCSSVGPSPPPSPGQAGASHPWTGTYDVKPGCDTTTCCCLTGAASIEQQGTVVTIRSPVVGQCGGQTSVVESATLVSGTSTQTRMLLGGVEYEITRSGDYVHVQNTAAPWCSGTAVKISSSVSPSSSGSGGGASGHEKATLALVSVGIVVALAGVGYYVYQQKAKKQRQRAESTTSGVYLAGSAISPHSGAGGAVSA